MKLLDKMLPRMWGAPSLPDKPLFVGFTTKPSASAKLAAPKAPKTWKDQEKIKRYVIDRTAAQVAAAANTPIAGRLSSVSLFSSNDDSCWFRYSGDCVGVSFARAIAAWWTDSDRWGPKPRLIGFDIHTCLQIAAYEVFAHNREHNNDRVKFLPACWDRESPFIMDPYKVLVPSRFHAAIDLPLLYQHVVGGAPLEAGAGADALALAAMLVATQTYLV